MLFSNLGYYALISGLFFSIILIPIAYRDLNFINHSVNSNILKIVFLQLFSVLLSFISLVISFINSDFSNETVYKNSHTAKPLFYKISGTWGNHEGSLLLCLLVLILFIFIFLLTSKNEPKKLRNSHADEILRPEVVRLQPSYLNLDFFFTLNVLNKLYLHELVRLLDTLNGLPSRGVTCSRTFVSGSRTIS